MKYRIQEFGDGESRELLARSVGAHMTNRESDVRRVEELLQRAGYAAFDLASGPTGMSGYTLDRVTRDFQRDHGLKQDGMVYTDGPTIQALAAQGRNGDSEIAHLTPGETMVPEGLMTPGLRQELERAFVAEGLDIGRYTVGGGDDSINPETGAREYFDSESDTLLPPPTNDAVNEKEWLKKLKFDPTGPGDIMTAITNPRNAWELKNISDNAKKDTELQFPKSSGHNNEADAYRHALWNYKMTNRFGHKLSKQVSDGHERTPWGHYKNNFNMPYKPQENERLMDLYNNKMGRKLAEENSGDPDANAVVRRAMRNRRLQTRPFRFRK